MATQTQRLTYEEYLKSPEIKQRYEIVDGKMIMAPAPTLEHQTILRRLFLQVHQFVDQHGIGQVWFAPLDIVIQREPLRTRQPDLLFVSHERSSILGPVIEGPPDLVAEILSPGNARPAMEEKLADFGRLGVQECWIVSPEGHTVEVLDFSEGKWQRLEIYGPGDQLESRVLPGLAVPVAEIFG